MTRTRDRNVFLVQLLLSFPELHKTNTFTSLEAELHFIDEEMAAFHHDNKLAVSSVMFLENMRKLLTSLLSTIFSKEHPYGLSVSVIDLFAHCE